MPFFFIQQRPVITNMVGHFRSSTSNLTWVICPSLGFEHKVNIKMYARSILHLLKSLYKHIQSLNVLQSVNAMYMHEECKQWKISESFGIWKKIQRFVVSLLLNWLDFWYADVVTVCFKPAITNQLEGFCVVGFFFGGGGWGGGGVANTV